LWKGRYCKYWSHEFGIQMGFGWMCADKMVLSFAVGGSVCLVSEGFLLSGAHRPKEGPRATSTMLKDNFWALQQALPQTA
jgi:hypothetical protein